AESVSLALEGEYRDLSLKAEDNQSGFDNLSIMLKYAPVRNPAHEFIFSFAFEVAPPTGDRGVGATKNAVLAPLALLGKGFGDLPQPLSLLRPFAVMGDAGFEFPVTRNASDNDVFAYDLLLTYSLSYLESRVWNLGIPPVLDDLNPVVEFNFETVLNGPDRQTAVRVTPGLVYLGRYAELGVAGQFPLNNAADTELDWGILGIIDIFYDDLFEALGKWQPFSGLW
ncbi:MAG: hypothetical protein ACE5I7_17830, partial [Candidatus Binatia bacterium]